MSKEKTMEITLIEKSELFSIFKKPNKDKSDFDFEGVASLRKLISNEKARLLHIIKSEKPGSIYQLARMLNRDFKGVYDDLKFLERFGLIEFISEKYKGRIRHRPEVVIDVLNFHLKI